MPFKLSDSRIPALVGYITGQPDGASLPEIEQQLSPRVPHRTLQRWMAVLVDSRLLRRRGNARSTRYALGNGRSKPRPKRPHKAPETAKSAAPATPVVPIPAPIPPPKRPAPATKDDPRLQQMFNEVVPEIVRLALPRGSAQRRFELAAFRLFGSDPDVISAAIAAGMAEVDGLNETNYTRYPTLRPQDIKLWTFSWKTLRQ
jgi:hypothetical protein